MSAKYKKLVVPTDFSDTAQMALLYALDLVHPEGKIILCHVVDDVPLTYGYVGMSLDTRDLRSRLAVEAEKELKAIIPVMPEGIRVETRVLHGAPYQEIIKVVKEELADLVVMGTHGRSGLGHMLLGSVAEKVIRKSPSPVLVVREGGAGYEAA